MSTSPGATNRGIIKYILYYTFKSNDLCGLFSPLRGLGAGGERHLLAVCTHVKRIRVIFMVMMMMILPNMRLSKGVVLNLLNGVAVAIAVAGKINNTTAHPEKPPLYLLNKCYQGDRQPSNRSISPAAPLSRPSHR